MRQLPAVRVPVPLAILMSLAVISGVWWYGSRNHDFLTPPSEARLAEILAQTQSSLPTADDSDARPAESPEIKPSTPAPLPAEQAKPVIALGDLSKPPSLLEYADLAQNGAGQVIDLATLLETKGETQRALLAWERVLDLGAANPSQTIAAISAIKRLRPSVPDWNTDPSKSITITLQAGTGKKTAKILTPILEETAREIERFSAGILKVRTKLSAAQDTKTATGPAPVALWLAGSTNDSRTTGVLSFTIGAPETLNDEVRKQVFKVIQGYIGHKGGQTPPPSWIDGAPVSDAMNHHITRFYWRELGEMLNRPPEITE